MCDVWTVFDIIFTSVSAIGVLFLLMTLFVRKREFLIGSGIFFAVLLLLTVLILPAVFGAGLKDIAFVWAPWSFTAGLVIFVADIAGALIRLVVVKRNEGRTKTG